MTARFYMHKKELVQAISFPSNASKSF